MALKTHPTDKSSDGLDNAAWSPRSPADRILMHLKMHGALSAAALGERLGISGEAVRQQLARLGDEGLVSPQRLSSGVGRPTQLWMLTPAAQGRFPDTHAALTVQILDILRSQLGDAALDAVISVRETETSRAYQERLASCTDLRDRVAALADLRTREGYMAAWSEEDDGTLLLVENHCPICAAATACQGFCRAELDAFRSVLGPDVEIERQDHIVSGGRRCSYTIRSAIHEPA